MTKHIHIKTGALFGCFGEIALLVWFRLQITPNRNYSLCSRTTNWSNILSTLGALKLSAVLKPAQMPAVQQRRNKLAKRLHEQLELARAQQAGAHYAPVKFRTVKDADTGARKQIETSKRVKAWWFTADNGKLALCVRYGTKILELAKGKYAIEIATANDLVSTLETVKTAVLAGELDTAIDNAANKLRAGFVK
jgi:hypothetical protein